MTSSKVKNTKYTTQFKEETVALVTEQGYTVIEVAEAVGVRANQTITGNNGSLTKTQVLE